MTDTRAHNSTLIRESVRQQEDGCWLLSEANVDYLEGAEGRIYEILAAADDLSSLSDELNDQATNWFEHYNLSKSRANILRPLRLGREDTVLEVGAGCGAITRYLGETCGLVDALEPVRERARVARQRTRDLDNVEVFVGAVEDLPPEPTYDTIVMVGVLEYSRSGSADPRDYTAFLQPLARLLKPGGRIICAIENQIGVKYLAGAPENHTNRTFDGVEQYPRGAAVRTFSREALEAIFRDAGLAPETLLAFPDYHLARIVFSDALLESEASALAWSVPSFPSPDYLGERPRLASEALLWQTLAEAGVGSHFANAFIVTAGKQAEPGVWPEDQLAAFYSTHRRAQFATETRVTERDSCVKLERRLMVGSGNKAALGPLGVEVRDADFVPGESVLNVMARSDDSGLSDWLKRWLALLHDNVNEGGAANIDIGPPHMIVRSDSTIALIDQEMRHEGYDEQDVLMRQLLWLAPCLTDRTPPERWNAHTPRDVVRSLGAMAGLDPGGDWLPGAVRREAELQALVADGRFGTDVWPGAVDRWEGLLNRILDTPLEDGPLGRREHERRQAAVAEAAEARERLQAAERDLEDAHSRITEIEGSAGWRALNRVRPIVQQIAPKGSARRRTVSSILRASLRITRTARRPFVKRVR